MKYVILTMFLLLFSTSAFSTTTDTIKLDGLTEKQKAEILYDIAIAKENGPNLTVQPEEVKEWVDLGAEYGKTIGQTIGGIAKELGIAANEFVNTPVGFVSIALIVWHFAGDDIMDITTSVVWYIVMLPLWVFLFFRIAYTVTGYTEKTTTRWGKTYTKSVPLKSLDSDVGVTFLVFMIGIILIGLILLA